MKLNNLEDALASATKEPGLRPAFYKLLMQSSVLILMAQGSDQEQSEMFTWMTDQGEQVAPCFTSPSAIKRFPPIILSPNIGKVTVFRIPVRTLMKQTTGLHFHLNPESEYDLFIYPEDVAILLKDETLHGGVQRPETLPSGLLLQLNKLTSPMPDLERALSALFRTLADVQIAYLVETQRVRKGRLAPVLMLVAHAKPTRELINAVSTVFSEVYKGLLPVDLCFDDGNQDFVETLKRTQAKPFYDRSVELQLLTMNGHKH